MSFLDPQNPGIGGLEELTDAETALVQSLAALGDPGANRILGWDDTDNAYVHMVIGSGLSYDAGTNTLSSTGTVDGSGTTNEIAYWVDSNTLGALAVATYPSLTELSYVKGVTSALQTQLNAKQGLDTQLTSLAGLSYSGNGGKFIRVTAGEDGFELATVAAGGDVSKVGTPADNQIGVWTGDGTIEGDADLTFDTASNTLALAGAAGTSIFAVGGANILVDNPRGTMTLSNIDAIDATTESTIEAAIDTLANLTSIQGRTVTLADAGANAFFGWDDTAGAYENLTQAEARTVLGLGTAAYVATDLSDLNEATIEAAIDTLANLVSIQGRTVTLADAGANAVFGWDDTAGAYENLTATEVRNAIGLGTGDSPQFTALNIGDASDTTLTRSSAGNLAIEGNLVYRAGGTDVPVADGGTGRSSHTAYAVICGGTDTTTAQQSIAGVGTSGQVLTSNGAGALPTFQDAGGVGEDELVVATISISSSDILNSHTTPKQLVAAPGAGKIVIVEEVVFSFTVGTQYTSGDDLTVEYADGSTDLVPLISNSIIIGAANSVTLHTATASATRLAITEGINKAVQLKNPNANDYITGTGTAKVFIKYRTLTL